MDRDRYFEQIMKLLDRRLSGMIRRSSSFMICSTDDSVA